MHQPEELVLGKFPTQHHLFTVVYEQLIYTPSTGSGHCLPARYPSICLSTLVLVPPGLDTARLTGLVALGDDCVLCVYELLNFQQGVIEAYRYEVSRCRSPFTESPLPEATEYCRTSYPGKAPLYWYDSWPHPHDPTLACKRSGLILTISTYHRASSTIEFRPLI